MVVPIQTVEMNNINVAQQAAEVVQGVEGAVMIVELDVTNVGQFAGSFYIVGAAGQSDLADPTPEQLLNTVGGVPLTPADDPAWENRNIVGWPGGLGIVTRGVAPGETRRVAFGTPGLRPVGMYDVSLQTGVVGPENNIETVDDIVHVLDAIEILRPGEGEISNVTITRTGFVL